MSRPVFKEKDRKISTTKELADFISETAPASAFFIAGTGKTEMSIVVVNGQPEFLEKAAFTMMAWLETYFDSQMADDEEAPQNRAERRRRRSARYR